MPAESPGSAAVRRAAPPAGDGRGGARARRRGDRAPGRPPLPVVPILPGSQRITFIQPRSGRDLDIQRPRPTPDGYEVFIIRNGVNIVVNQPGQFGTIDVEADQAVIWRGPEPQDGQKSLKRAQRRVHRGQSQALRGLPRGECDRPAGPEEVRRPRRPADPPRTAGLLQLPHRPLRRPRRRDRHVRAGPARPAEGQVAQDRAIPRADQAARRDAQAVGAPEIRADKAITTGSRFPDPGYQIHQKSIDLKRYARPSTNPISGQHLTNPGDPNPPEDLVWQIDARQNFYYMGPVPAFYWPRIVADLDDEQRAFRQFFFRTNNYFGQQLLTDWNGFRFLNVKKPDWIDLWNIDFDYLSARTKRFPALGTEIGWFGNDLIKDLRDPYHKTRKASDITYNYFGYFTIWGLQDYGTDVLGQGPAIVTNGPPGAGKAGIQMSSDAGVPAGPVAPGLPAHAVVPPRRRGARVRGPPAPARGAYYTDRYFLFEYFQQLWDRGMDQETLAFGYWQKDNQFADIWVEGNPMNWQTETQWLPRFDYYRISDSFLDNHVIYYEHSGVDYATITTDIMVNNPNLFAFMPYDPISNTSGTFSSGRFWTSHELDLPAQPLQRRPAGARTCRASSSAGSTSSARGRCGTSPPAATGRAWGGVGSRAEMTLWKKYPTVESDILNVHGLNNKISLFVDARAAFSNVRLNSIAVQDDLDDNTYEFVRRYFAMTSFHGRDPAVPLRPPALHPAQHDLADHGDDRHPGVDRHRAARHPPAAPDQARPDRPSPDRRLHDPRRHHHLLPQRRPRQLRHAVGPDPVQLPVVPRATGPASSARAGSSSGS